MLSLHPCFCGGVRSSSSRSVMDSAAAQWGIQQSYPYHWTFLGFGSFVSPFTHFHCALSFMPQFLK